MREYELSVYTRHIERCLASGNVWNVIVLHHPLPSSSFSHQSRGSHVPFTPTKQGVFPIIS